MLGHPDRGRRQLRDLVPRWLSNINTLPLAEEVRTRPATLGPMLDDPVDLVARKQPPVPALVPRLTPTLASTRPLLGTRRRRGRIL
jgi:hypothetical protein